MSTVLYRFRGRFETFGDGVWAVCDHAPVFVSGDSEEDALSHMAEAAAAYIDVLFEGDESEDALAAGRLVKVSDRQAVPCTRVEPGARFEAVVAHGA